jgi:hypothetical protein
MGVHRLQGADVRTLREESVVKEYLTTAADGKRYQTLHYNLDVIISVGYRVRSPRGTQGDGKGTGSRRSLKDANQLLTPAIVSACFVSWHGIRRPGTVSHFATCGCFAFFVFSCPVAGGGGEGFPTQNPLSERAWRFKSSLWQSFT